MASFVGFAAFWYVVGLRVLDVTNVRWLLVGDSAQAYLGWEFFRKTPLLQWPLGNNPNFGVGFNSTIVFADGIPLVSIVLKPLTAWYDGVFQFHGWWLLIAFILQAVLTVKILEQLGVTRNLRLLALPLLLLQPAFLDRMRFDGYGHLALSAHWLILLGVLLLLRKNTTHIHWGATLVLAIGVTIYFFIILAMFYVAWILGRIWQVHGRFKTALKQVPPLIGVVAASLLFVWAIGGLSSASLEDSGLGVYRATLTSLVDSTTLNGVPWSRLVIIPDITNLQGSQEGFAFLGLAGLLLVVYSIIRMNSWAMHLASPRGVTVALLAAVFFVLALSPRIGLGAREVASYSWPGPINDAFSIVRSSGRLMWVPMYVLLIFSIAIAGRAVVSRSRALNIWLSLVIVGTAGMFHLFETRQAVDDVRSRFSDTDTVLVTDNQQWDSWASGKTHLVAIPPLSNDPRWIDLAVLAARHNLTTNAAYVSRKDEQAFQQLVSSTQRLLEQREFSADTLYVITNYPPNSESTRLIEESRIKGDQPAVYQAEELVVVVP